MKAQAGGRAGTRVDRRLFLTTLGLGAAGAAVTGGFSSRKLAAVAPGNRLVGPQERLLPLTLSAQSYDFRDFTEPTSGGTCALLAGGIIGKGPNRTIIDLTGPILTDFPEFQLGETTRWNVIRVQSAIGRLSRPILSGFTLKVSAPAVAGELFNGLRIAAADDLLIQDVHVVGVPGTGNLPPFETFGIDLIDCKRPTLKRVRVDGKSRGSAGIGINLATDVTLDSCVATHNAFSHGFTCFQVSRARFINCVSQDNGTGTRNQAGVGFNHEESFNTTHINSRAIDNSLASFRYWAAHRTTTGHLIARSYANGEILVQGDQSPDDIAVEGSKIVKGIVVG